MSQHSDPTPAALWIVLARAYHSMAAYVEESIASLNVGLSDFMILEALLHKGPMPVLSLGDVVLLASPSMSAAVDRLEEKKYVERVPHATDRRVRLVQLTPEGTTVARRLYAKHLRDIEEVMEVVPDLERRYLYQRLKLLGTRAEHIPADRREVARRLKQRYRTEAAENRGRTIPL